MRIAVFAYSRQGCKTAKRILELLKNESCMAYTLERFQIPEFLPLQKPSVPFYGELFAGTDAMIFVGSCGIAVRQIAPHVRDKKTDPAVLCVDELGTYVIPILSGHIGGANAMAGRLAGALKAQAVITTATDINGKFSVDTWAAENACAISSMTLAKEISAAILEHPIPLCSDFPISGDLPEGLFSDNCGKLGIAVTWKTTEPFEKTLRLIPRALHLGIGCRRDTTAEAIQTAVEVVLNEHKIDRKSIQCAASIDLKSKEQGLLEFCDQQRLPITFYSAEELLSVEGTFTSSDFVRSITGVDNVCERSALLGAEKLIIKKTALNGVTVALAAEKWEVHFG